MDVKLTKEIIAAPTPTNATRMSTEILISGDSSVQNTPFVLSSFVFFFLLSISYFLSCNLLLNLVLHLTTHVRKPWLICFFFFLFGFEVLTVYDWEFG